MSHLLDRDNFNLLAWRPNMYPAGNLLIPVAHGQLEAILKEPRTDPPKGVALVLHQHPLGGGTMHNKVVFRAAAALQEAGLVTLRINFRGVGQSTGEHDEGRGELEDVRAGLAYLKEQYSDLNITICGFSFGAWVGLEVGIGDNRVVNLVSIGTPLDRYDFSFLTACRKSLLFVHGDGAEFGDVEKLRALAEELKAHTSIQVSIISGAGHFFEGHLDELKAVITKWINEQFGTSS
ncbi:MAG: alpha/beta hydrolase [Pyrinomonadaceae bacterium]